MPRTNASADPEETLYGDSARCSAPEAAIGYKVFCETPCRDTLVFRHPRPGDRPTIAVHGHENRADPGPILVF